MESASRKGFVNGIIMASLLVLGACSAQSQTLGGTSVFNFINLPNTPQLTALGGVNVSNRSSDVGLAFNNPALLRESMHGQFSAVFSSLYAGIHTYHAMGAYSSQQLKTTFSAGVLYFDYGNIPQTDPAGNILGSFRPVDYVTQVSASRRYMQHWTLGLTGKYIHSGYGMYRSSGLALDAAAAYYDSTTGLQVSLAVRNMGTQVKKYPGSQGDELPFDLDAGITKKLQHAPIQFSLTGHHLQRFNILYQDTAFNNDNNADQHRSGTSLAIDKVFRHIIFATQVFVGDHLELTGAYNHLRRAELNLAGSANGLNGFSLGIGVLFSRIQIRYARSYYQSTTAYNQLGINLHLNEYFGVGSF